MANRTRKLRISVIRVYELRILRKLTIQVFWRQSSQIEASMDNTMARPAKNCFRTSGLEIGDFGEEEVRGETDKCGIGGDI